MIRVDTYKHIKDLHIKERKSIRNISKETGLSRQTLRKILYGSVEEATRYKRQAPHPAPLKEKFSPIVREWLIDDIQSPSKQRHNAKRIHERLEEEYDFNGGYSTVRGWVRELKQELNIERIEAFMPLDHDPIGHAQCDWTPVSVKINGAVVTGELFLMRFSYSKYFFVRFYPHQRQEAFFDAHEKSFKFFGGVPSEILYDNLKTAVKKVLVGRKREEQDSFIKFRAHHGFDSSFCNVAKGNEKGCIETLARYAKLHIFTPLPDFADIATLNVWIEQRCHKINAKQRSRKGGSFSDLFEQEQPNLLPLSPHTFDCCSRKEVKVNRFSLIQFNTNQYSVPVGYTGRILTAKGYIHEIKIYDKQTLLAVHPRDYGTGKEHFMLEHYLKLLERKPRSVSQSRPVRQAQLPVAFQSYHLELRRQYPDESDKMFVKVLLLIKTYPVQKIEKALEKALQLKTLSIEILHGYLDETIKVISPLATVDTPLNENRSPIIAPTQLNRYNELMRGGKSA